MSLNADTYRRLTLEFLASARRNVVEINRVDVVQLSFQVFNEPHSFTMDEINDIFEFQTNNDLFTNLSTEVIQHDKGYDKQSRWREIMDEEDFISSSSKASSYIHPAMRYVSHLLVFCFFSKNTKVAALWMDNEAGCKGYLDFGNLLVSRITDTRDGTTYNGDIQLGEMFTLLVMHIEDNKYKELLLALPPIGGKFLITEDLVQAKWMQTCNTPRNMTPTYGVWVRRERNGASFQTRISLKWISYPSFVLSPYPGCRSWKTCAEAYSSLTCPF